MNVLILGGTGFIGKNVTQQLIKNGHNVTLIIHRNLTEYLTKNKENPKLFFGDILNKNTIGDAFKNQDIVLNLVGQICTDLNLFYNINIIGAINILESCKENRIKNIVLISSSMIYGESGEKPSRESDPPNPMTTYSLTKLITENIYIHFAREYNFNLNILRLSNVYGLDKKNGIIHNIISAMDKNQEIIIHNDGTQMRDYIYIDDVTDGIIKVVEKLPEGIEIFNISNSTKVSLLEIISIIEKHFCRKARVKFVQDKAYDEQCVWADNTKAKRIFNFSPKINMDEGIKNNITYLRTVN